MRMKNRLQIVTTWRRILMKRNQRKLRLKRLLENQVKKSPGRKKKGPEISDESEEETEEEDEDEKRRKMRMQILTGGKGPTPKAKGKAISDEEDEESEEV